jgi:hypothetical protein
MLGPCCVLLVFFWTLLCSTKLNAVIHCQYQTGFINKRPVNLYGRTLAHLQLRLDQLGYSAQQSFPPDLAAEAAEELRQWPDRRRGDRSGATRAAPHRSCSYSSRSATSFAATTDELTGAGAPAPFLSAFSPLSMVSWLEPRM